jgi:hypothetical protein
MHSNLLCNRAVKGIASFSLSLAAICAWSGEDTTQAVWKPIDTVFTYSGFTSYFSCDGLADRVRDVLRQVGARHLKVYGLSCMGAGGPSVAPGVRIMGEIPVEATPETVAAVAKVQEQRAKDGYAAKPTRASPDEFTAIRRTVTLSNRRDLATQSGDCELLEQIQGRLFPEIGIKVTAANLYCTPRHLDIATRTMEVETLSPVNKAVAEATP